MDEELTKGEIFLIDWQFRNSGSFMNNLATLIGKADSTNKTKLAAGFPEEVTAVNRFYNWEGYWEEVVNKAIALNVLPEHSRIGI